MDKMFTKIVTPYEFAVKNDMLADDDFHPSPDGHLNWTREVLLPKLQTIIA
jgi:lysophospholipase L1-like esterase